MWFWRCRTETHKMVSDVCHSYPCYMYMILCNTRNGHSCEELLKKVLFNIGKAKNLCISCKFLHSDLHATCICVMVDYHFRVLSLRTLPASCNFGPQPGCRFPCHCAGGGDCDSLTGECGGSGECERLPLDTSRVQTGWTGLACQTGKDGMTEMSVR